MIPEEKIETLVEEERIFEKANTEKYIYFVVRGTSKKIYEVIYNKAEDDFYCSCKNIRLTPCYHIRAVKLYMEINDGKNRAKSPQ